MEKIVKIIRLFIFGIVALFLVNINESMACSPYTSVPPFVQANLPSNVMLILDYSGSMSWRAYGYYYDPTKTYYGYFVSDKNYSYDDRYDYWYSDKYGSYSGNYLNWLFMTRIDILRWILTGGDVETYGAQEYVNGYYSYDKVYYKDASSYNDKTGEIEGILQKIGAQDQKPRMGASIFGYGDSGRVFERVGLSYDYSNLIDTINSTDPNGYTCTKCAVDEVKDLYSEDSATINEYGKQDPYVFDINNVETTVRCAKNFILLMSDGEWNRPDTTTDSDPIKPINDMWLGGDADLVTSLDGNQQVETYTVSMFSNPDDSGTNALKWMAVYGNYNDMDGNDYPCNQSKYPDTSLTVTENLENSSTCNEVKVNNDSTGPYGYFEGKDPGELKKSISEAFSEMLKQASAGSSVSVLAKKTNKGSLLNQAVFYAEKTVNGTKLDWIGQLFAYWFYNEKGVQNIREDTLTNHILDICSGGNPGGDNILEFDVDNNTGKLSIKKYGSYCDGTIDYNQEDTANSLDDLANLWEAGYKLAARSYDNRTIYTDYNGSLLSFDASNDDIIKKYLGSDNYTDSSTPFPDNMTSVELINYIRGLDIAKARNRSFDDNGTKETWKLGDIVYSSPKVVDYGDYSMVFVGANDGMIHAFRLGYLSNSGLTSYQSAKICNSKDNCNIDQLGQEEWAFIPKNVLPYLRYLADPDYCHIYTVDLTPYIVYKVESDNTVKRILIGGMRFGGGVTGCVGTECVNPPDDTCPASAYDFDNDSCVGRSSYFALDVTNPDKPKFLWEFNRKYLGFSYSGPGIIKIDGIYYIVFMSGPTDYKGESAQDLQLYVLKLNPDFTIDKVYDLSSKIPVTRYNAFGSRIMTQGIDGNDDGNTDLLFLGMTYFNGNTTSGSHWQGNVMVIETKDDTDPNDWTIEKVFDQGTSAITSGIEYMKCFNHNYIYFGTGRWFYKEDDPGLSGFDVENLYGVMIDGCFDGKCNIDSVKNTDDSCKELTSANPVWAYEIPLEPRSADYYKERLISNPTVDPYDNLVFFATTEPSSDICSFGGRSRLWGLNCATGLSMFDTSCPGYVSNILSNTVYMQLSRGNIVQVNKNAFNGGSVTQWHQGVTPETGPILPPPYVGVKGSILLWLEK